MRTHELEQWCAFMPALLGAYGVRGLFAASLGNAEGGEPEGAEHGATLEVEGACRPSRLCTVLPLGALGCLVS